MNEKSNPSRQAPAGHDAWSYPSAQESTNDSSKVMEGARELAQNVKHVAGDVAEQARKTAESQVSNSKTRAVESLSSVAHAIRRTGEQLRAEDQGEMTTYLDRAARQVDAAAVYIRNRTIGEIAADVEGFARREPALFLGGAFVAGLMGGRFIKSSTIAPATSSGALGSGRSPNEHWQAPGDVSTESHRAPETDAPSGRTSGLSASQRDVGGPPPSRALHPADKSSQSKGIGASSGFGSTSTSASTTKNGNVAKEVPAPKAPSGS
ncbi:MAG: hypothetical protein ABSC94_24890 [Polyangiaceae bacterium]